MRSFLCCLMLMARPHNAPPIASFSPDRYCSVVGFLVDYDWIYRNVCAVMAKANPVPFYQEPAKLDTPDDQDVGKSATAGTGANAIPQGGSPAGSSFLPPSVDSSSSSSSSEEDYGSDVDLPDGGGSVPAGTALPGSGPVVGVGNAEGNAATGGDPGAGAQGDGRGGNRGISDQNSGEVAGNPAPLSDIQAKPKTNSHKSGAGKSAGIAIGVLGLISVATVAIIFTIRKRRNGFMRFYTQANAEL